MWGNKIKIWETFDAYLMHSMHMSHDFLEILNLKTIVRNVC